MDIEEMSKTYPIYFVTGEQEQDSFFYDKLEEIKREQIIFSVTDYTASVQNLKREKQKIDEQLEELKK